MGLACVPESTILSISVRHTSPHLNNTWAPAERSRELTCSMVRMAVAGLNPSLPSIPVEEET